MNRKRTAMLGVFGATLVTLLARAATSSLTPVPVVQPTPPPTEDPRAPFAEVDRLRERLRAPVAAATPSRNLFTFRQPSPPRSREASASSAAVTEVAAPPVPPVTHVPPLAFIGLVDDIGQEGRVRTAILSGAGGLHFAEVGAVVAGYRVTAIRDDAVELTGPDEGTPVVLPFK